MSEIDVSVIIPTFHRERLVLEAIGSVLAHRGLSMEILVLDDSAEGSASEAVSSIADTRVRYIKCADPSGGKPALVRNAGAALSRGRFLHFLDDDDLLETDALNVLADSLERSPQCGMAFGAIIPFGDDLAALRHEQRYMSQASSIARGLRGRMELVATLLFQSTILVNSACMVRRHCFLACGGYDSNIPVCEDVELWMRIARADDFVYVDRPVIHYRTGLPSLMRSLVENDERLRIAYQRSQSNYRARYGLAETLMLKLWTKTLLRRKL
jgi:glycosyltransferase involved in cell wall biosynthesis